LEILCELLASEYDENSICFWGLIEPGQHEFFAIVALMAICQVAHLNDLGRIAGESISASFIKSIGVHTINAIEAIAVARRILWEKHLEKRFIDQQPEVLKAALAENATERAKKAAKSRHERDPKQKAKIDVEQCWNLWQRNPTNYKSKASFAKDMLEKYELSNQQVIVRWCTGWEKSRYLLRAE
jgi:hypothetical protein